MSSATIQTDHETHRSRQHDGATVSIAPAVALESLLEFQPEVATGKARVVADQRLLIVNELAGWDEFPAEERPAFAFENLWPELVSFARAQREYAKRSFSLSHPSETWNVRALLARMRRSLSSIPWAWIRPFTWGAAIGAATVFLLIEGARQTRPTNARLASGRVPFALTARPSVTENRIVVTTPPVFREGLAAQRPAPDRQSARATHAAPDVRTVAPFIGGMAITSMPEGAQVFVNGQLKGVTPLVLDGLPIGTRAVRVEAQDYIGWSSSVRVVANERTRVGVTLTRK